MTTNVGPTERAQQAASTAAEEGKHVSDVAKEETQKVASAAADQARNLMDEAITQVSGQVNDQVAGQRDQLVGVLGSLGDEFQSMAQNGSGLAADLARDVGERARSLSQHLDGREPGQLLDEVRDFARRRPGTFLIGALATGVVAGRLFRGAAEGTAGAAAAVEQSGQSPSLQSSAPPPATSPPPPPVGPPTVSSGPGQVGGPTPSKPPMPSSTPGQPTIEPPGAMP